MTDTTPGAGLPDERFGPETAGPEATAEQEAYVAGLLGSLRADDPEIPDHVAARIDGVLAGAIGVSGAPTAMDIEIGEGALADAGLG